MRPSRRRALEGYVADSGIERVLGQLSSAVVTHMPADPLAGLRIAAAEAAAARDGVTRVTLAAPLLLVPSDGGTTPVELVVGTSYCQQRAALQLAGADARAVEAAAAALDAGLRGVDPRDQAACDGAIGRALAGGGGGDGRVPPPQAHVLPPPAAQALATAASLLVAAAGAAAGDAGSGPAPTVAAHVGRLACAAAGGGGGGSSARKPPSAVSALSPLASSPEQQHQPATPTAPRRVSFALLAGSGALTLRELGITLPLPSDSGSSGEWTAVWQAAQAAHAALAAHLSDAVAGVAGGAGGKPGQPPASAAPKKPAAAGAQVPATLTPALALAPSGALVWPADLPVPSAAPPAGTPAAAAKRQPVAAAPTADGVAAASLATATAAKGKGAAAADAAGTAPSWNTAAPPPPAPLSEPARTDAADAPLPLPPAWAQALAAVRAAVAVAGAASAGVYMDVGADALLAVPTLPSPTAGVAGANHEPMARSYRVAPDALPAPAAPPPAATTTGKAKPPRRNWWRC
jgi:hypothetical protein